MAEDEVAALVVDNGSGMCKVCAAPAREVLVKRHPLPSPLFVHAPVR